MRTTPHPRTSARNDGIGLARNAGAKKTAAKKSVRRLPKTAFTFMRGNHGATLKRATSGGKQ